MDDQPTCGKGLAAHAPLPAKLAELTDAVAENLELHIPSLDPSDEHARRELEVYRELADHHRETAGRLRAAAERMAGCRDLPMGRHDAEALEDPRIVEAFEKLVKVEGELLALLQERLAEHSQMLTEFRGESG